VLRVAGLVWKREGSDRDGMCISVRGEQSFFVFIVRSDTRIVSLVIGDEQWWNGWRTMWGDWIALHGTSEEN